METPEFAPPHPGPRSREFLDMTRAHEFPVVGDVRGRGLMAGIELVEDRTTRAPMVGGA